MKRELVSLFEYCRAKTVINYNLYKLTYLVLIDGIIDAIDQARKVHTQMSYYKNK